MVQSLALKSKYWQTYRIVVSGASLTFETVKSLLKQILNCFLFFTTILTNCRCFLALVIVYAVTYPILGSSRPQFLISLPILCL